MEHYHYLGYEQPVGEHLKYVLRAQGTADCLSGPGVSKRRGTWAAATVSSAGMRKRGGTTSVFLAYNTRFLILPWVAVPHMASHILSRISRRRLSPDWERAYGHPIYFLETFVDPERFSWNLLPGGQLGVVGAHHGPR